MVNIEQKNNSLIISYIDTTGNLQLKTIPIPQEEYYEWVYCDRGGDPVIRSWDDKKVKKQPARFLNNYRITEFLMTLPDAQQKELFSMNIPKKYYCDIETEMLEDYTDAKGAVLSIAIANEKDYIMVMGTRTLTTEHVDRIQNRLNEYFAKFGKNIKFEYKYFSSEYDMLSSFFSKAIKKLPFITGWNFVDFDWKYLITRAERLNIDYLKCAPTEAFNRDGMPLHKMIVDYMEVYKKWDKVVWMKESNGLDYVADAVLKVKKIKYQGTLSDLYNNDFETFIYYNAVDSYLVKLIDEKINTLMPYFMLTFLTRTDHDKAWSPVPMVENIMIQQLMKDRKRVFVRKERREVKVNKYDGAYVQEPVPGFHNYLGTWDYSSEYPTNIRQWNISPDVYLGKDKNAKFTDDTIITASGAIFKKNEDGVLRTLLTDLFNQRNAAKHGSGDVEEEIRYLESILKNK